MISEEAFARLKITQASLVAQLAEKSQLIARLEPLLRGKDAHQPTATELSGASALAAAIKSPSVLNGESAPVAKIKSK